MGTRTQQQCREDNEDDLPSGPGAATISSQSVSMSGSVGSPSSRSDQTMATPASDKAFLRLNNPDIHGDEAGSQGPIGNVKKKRGQRAVGGDKSGRGLRQFSMKVCEKVESKGRTNYNEVADELVAEFADPGNGLASPDQQQYDEKNIRRRVYDALNVLMAMDIISKDKKEIQWKGLPRTSANDIEELKQLTVSGYQYVGLQNLIQRNEQLFSYENAPSGGVSLPFILVQLVHFDFNSTPFELHDDNYVLKAMKFCDRPQRDDTAQNFTPDGGEGSSMYRPHRTPLPSMSNTPIRTPTSPPLPGIIKARIKHEH
ncbi:Transcription factor-like protein DPB [Cucurbita argyrosperma subsp. argyrosperma]|nr:Transcription factor-like protein DPB [Cucurbita argyrosperma subsp. argyrosperma]